MKPPRFDYQAPTDRAEVLELLAHHGPDAKILAGGQSLVPLLNMRLARPAVVVDVNRVADLAYLRAEDGALMVGATTRQSAVEESDVARAACPLLVEAVGLVAHPTIRHRGTIGGSLVHADPAAELPVAALALEATIHLARDGGERVVPAEEFFLGYLTSAVEPEELLVEVRFSSLPPRTGTAFREIARTHGNFAIVAVGAAVTLDAESGAVARARIALGGIGGGPVRAVGAEAALSGRAVTSEAIADAARAAAEEIEPESDLHASAAYRRDLTVVLVEEALAVAVRRAGLGGQATNGAAHG